MSRRESAIEYQRKRRTRIEWAIRKHHIPEDVKDAIVDGIMTCINDTPAEKLHFDHSCSDECRCNKCSMFLERKDKQIIEEDKLRTIEARKNGLK